MNEYEIMLLLDPELAEERANEIIQRIRDSVEARGAPGTATSRGAAAGSPTRSTTRARRSTTSCSSPRPAETLDEITRVLKITDGVIRHGAYRRVKGSTHMKAPAQIPVGRARRGGPVRSADDSDEASE